jgi:hypothetical protein
MRTIRTMPSRDELLVVRFVDVMGRTNSEERELVLTGKSRKSEPCFRSFDPELECRSPRLIGESHVNRQIFDRANRHRTQRFKDRPQIKACVIPSPETPSGSFSSSSGT